MNEENIQNENVQNGEFTDIVLVCKDCGAEFTFTAGEQEFYAQKGFTNQPQRCPGCRKARKAQRSNYNNNNY